VSDLKDEKLLKKQTYTKTEACKLYSRVFWIFLPNVVEINLYNLELYPFKVRAFFLRHIVDICVHSLILFQSIFASSCTFIGPVCLSVMNGVIYITLVCMCVTGNAGSVSVRGRHCPEPSSPTRTSATLPGKLFSPVFQCYSNHVSK